MKKIVTIFTIFLVAAMVNQVFPQALTQSQQREIFNKIDLNEDGSVSKREFGKMIRAVNKAQAQLAQEELNKTWNIKDRTYAGWTGTIQGFQIYFAWNPRLKGIEGPS